MSRELIESQEWSDLRRAVLLLENPGLAARLTSVIGAPVEEGLKMLPPVWHERLALATEGIVTRSLEMAISTLNVARTMGIAVPDDLSVIGFDNVPESALVNPPLTTIMQPLQRMGAEALRLLVDLIGGVERDTHIRLPTELVVRASCRPISAFPVVAPPVSPPVAPSVSTPVTAAGA